MLRVTEEVKPENQVFVSKGQEAKRIVLRGYVQLYPSHSDSREVFQPSIEQQVSEKTTSKEMANTQCI